MITVVVTYKSKIVEHFECIPINIKIMSGMIMFGEIEFALAELRRIDFYSVSMQHRLELLPTQDDLVKRGIACSISDSKYAGQKVFNTIKEACNWSEESK